MEAWRSNNYWVSCYNYSQEVRSGLSLPEKVIIHDATLRDGEQTPGIVLSKRDKVEIAEMLDRFGVERIEAGMPAVSREDADAIREICKSGLHADIFAFARATAEDIQLAKEVGVKGVIIEVPIGQPKLEYQFGWTWETVLKTSIKAIRLAKELGLYVVYFPYDTTRAAPEDLERLLLGVVKESKPDSVGVVDTTGCALPQAIAYLVKKVREITDLPVEIHTHNDLGMGVANALAGVAAGASVVHACVNGIGERTGNAALEEVALNLKILFGMDVPYKFDLVQELSELVKERTGFIMAPNKPLVGSGTFTRESGIGADMIKKFPLAMFSVDPAIIGQKPQMVLGKKSGRLSVKQKLEDLNLGELNRDLTDEVLSKIKDLGASKRGLVSDEEFIRIVEETRGLKK